MEVDPHGAAAMMGGQDSELGGEEEVKSAIVAEEGVRWGGASSRHCQPL